LGPLGTFLRIVVAAAAVPLTMVIAGAPPGPLWAAAGAGAVAGVFGAAVESTLGPELHLALHGLLWFGLTAMTVWSVGLLWHGWPVSHWTPVWAGAVTAVVESLLPADWIRH
jgi:hypothetical protein